MALSLGTLTAYVDEHKLPLITQVLFGSQTGKLLNMQAGIKYAATINKLTTNATFQAAGCTWNPSALSTITQRVLTVGHVQVMESICIQDLDQYYTSTMLKAGREVDQALPFEALYATLKADMIGRQLEIAYWQGDTASTNPNLKRFDGLLKLIDAAAASVNGNPTGITTATGITAANVVGVMNGIYGLIPANVLRNGNIKTMVGLDVFRTYQLALIAANAFNYSGAAAPAAGQLTITIPGTNLEIVALDGLTGTNRIIATDTQNMYIGVDMLNEEEKFKMWESQDNLDYRFLADFKAGTQIAFPEEIVSFKLV